MQRHHGRHRRRTPAPATDRGTRCLAIHCLVAAALMAGGDDAFGQEPAAAEQESTVVGILFDSDTPLELRIETDLRTLIDDRDSLESTEHPAMLTVRVGDEEPFTVEIDVKTRGHWRRQEKHCDFPPLRLDFPTKKVEGTVFANQDKLKLVTPCQMKQREYEEYVLREYAVYPLYNLVTPLSLRARLARTTYVDAASRMDSLTKHTFLIEAEEQMAARNDAKVLEVRGARFADVDSVQLGIIGVFMYMIGQTDWSLSGLHNIELVLGKYDGKFYPVSYDFDFTGIVDTRYARPDPRLRLRSVRDRLYRGTCLSEEHWATVLNTFREQKEAIYAVYQNVPDLPEGYVRDTHKYLDGFFRTIEDPRRVSSELIGHCHPEETIR